MTKPKQKTPPFYITEAARELRAEARARGEVWTMAEAIEAAEDMYDADDGPTGYEIE